MCASKSSTIDSTKQAALALLSRRDHSALELHNKLLKKGYPAEQIKSVLLFLTQNQLLNEQRYIENFIRMRSNKGYGPAFITQELRAKGIASDIIAQHLDISDNAWLREVRKVWQKKFRGKRPTTFKEKAQQMRFLQYRGYTPEHIQRLFEED